MLLKKHRNQLFTILQEHNLSVDSFTITNNERFVLEHPESAFRFTLLANTGGHELFTGGFLVWYTPDIYATPEPDSSDIPCDWASVVRLFTDWTSALQEELELPDLWAEAVKNAQLFAHAAEAPDEKFTRSELAQVQGQLRQLEQSFAAAALPEADRQKLMALTQEAGAKAEGFSKRDWRGWFIGGLILTPAPAQEVLKLVQVLFDGLFRR